MKVYVLNCEYDYEGEATLGVYATLEDAVAAAKMTKRGDWLNVYEFEVGAAPQPILWEGDGLRVWTDKNSRR